MFLPSCRNIYRNVQTEGLVINYREDNEFALKIKMLPRLSFIPEMDVIDSFNLLMQDFPQSAMILRKYIKDNYIGKRIPNGSRRIPMFPIMVLKMYSRIAITKLALTTMWKVGIMPFYQRYHALINLLECY